MNTALLGSHFDVDTNTALLGFHFGPNSKQEFFSQRLFRAYERNGSHCGMEELEKPQQRTFTRHLSHLPVIFLVQDGQS